MANTKLHLTSCFHGNLLSSNIPDTQYSKVLDRCYWPVLELVEKINGLRLGVEFPAQSLLEIAGIDKSFINKLVELEKAKKIEVIASGYVQAIQPLLPYEVNKANLLLGRTYYEQLLDRVPRTAYLNEQTISDHTHELYKECGFDSFIMDFDNCRLAAGLPAEYLYFVQKVKNSNVKVLWNSSIAFQRFQRYIYGLLSLEDYKSWLLGHYSDKNDRVLMFYGSDWEIFDYKPGDIDINYVKTEEEICRLGELLSNLASDSRVVFSTPSEVLDRFPADKSVNLTSPECPVPCKKQSKYNIVRWAVCGRDNSRSNTDCYKLYYMLRKIAGLEGHPIVEPHMRHLLELFASDYRTFTTEKKYQDFINKTASFGETINDHYSSIAILSKTPDMTLVNPYKFDWNRYPVFFRRDFEQGGFRDLPQVRGEDGIVPAQYEDVERFRDGSLRSATVVITPLMAAGRKMMINFIKAESPQESKGSKHVELELNREKGAVIKKLTFKSVHEQPLIGEVEHYEYNDIRVSTDQFTGHMLLFNKDGQKIVDLGKPQEIVETPGIIYDRVQVKISTSAGIIWKTYFIYKEMPRVDMRYHFRFNDLEPLSFRLGTVTMLPDSFDKDSLHYQTVNGTQEIDLHMLKEAEVNHGAPVSLDVSAYYCLGATEGWVSVGDKSKSLAVITNKAELYSVPMLEYRVVSGKPYCRIYHSVAESDATSQPFWRGHNHITFTFFAHKNDMEEVRRQAISINQGLIII